MKFFYSDTFNLNLPPGHRFPARKYSLLRETLISESILSEDMLHLSPLANKEDVLRAHDSDYVMRFETGTLDEKEIRRIGFPWHSRLVTRTLASTGGAVAAAFQALEDGLSGQLAGGTHHAHRDFGSGYCIYNDFAVAALAVLAANAATRVAIVDLDVHQGDGNAAILGPHENVFVFSMHGDKNFPFRKVPSDYDVPLPDGIEDDAYLAMLEHHLPAVWGFKPDLVLYQAGVDPLTHDRLGRMSLSYEGLMTRDRMVLKGCKDRNIPISMGIGGGYSDPIEQSVRAYVNTYQVAKGLFGF
ncbi:histone deacetylase [Terasakiella sp. A23]|uniref:histone deacetylase family protein n=1 Tax=Terasakiella sp. FCG-A23 TaxID=3080561 RepID=UPI002954FD9A|nr:histone deacetylase [Terasakiella sp. A23]MDV7341054.1 histone deacetylase [Terasakiella sp. A23]